MLCRDWFEMLLKAALFSTFGIAAGCGGQTDPALPAGSQTDSLAPVVTVQGQTDSALPVATLQHDDSDHNNTSGNTVTSCQSHTSDPDGDGWGWENQQTCKVSDPTSETMPGTSRDLPVGIIYYLWHLSLIHI